MSKSNAHQLLRAAKENNVDELKRLLGALADKNATDDEVTSKQHFCSRMNGVTELYFVGYNCINRSLRGWIEGKY
jgi:hypothetical protein